MSVKARTNVRKPPAGSGVIEIRRGREDRIFTIVPDWITVSGISNGAHSLYVKLAMHVNQVSGDQLVWPSQDRLAALMGFNRADSVRPYLTELERIGAIDVYKVGMPAKTVYVVNKIPADGHCVVSGYPLNEPHCGRHGDPQTDDPCPVRGYDGPMTLGEFNTRNEAAFEARKEKASAKRARRLAREQPETDDDEVVKPQVAPVPRSSAEQGVSGLSVPRSSGEHVPRSSGGEQVRREQPRTEQVGGTLPPSPLRPDDPTSSGHRTEQTTTAVYIPTSRPPAVRNHRPRAREAAPAGTVSPPDPISPPDGPLPRAAAIALARANAAPRRSGRPQHRPAQGLPAPHTGQRSGGA